MSKEKGYVRLYRSLSDNFLWLSNEHFDKRSAWIDLILMANYQPVERFQDGVLIKLDRGELFASRSFLMNRWGWSKDKVLRFLRLLETQGMVHQSPTTKGTIIRIENYGFYQGDKTADDTTNETADRPPARQQTIHNLNKVKESNTSKKNIRGGGRIVEE